MLNKMNEVMHYIENHLIDNLDLDKKVPQITGESLSQFKKIFLFISNITLLEYIRKRWLTLAAYDLRERRMKVIDVAIKYRYSSPDSFTKAFYNFHQVTPSMVYEQNIQIKSFAPIFFQATMSGGSSMDYRIEEKGPFQIVGLKQRVPFITEGDHKEILAMRESFDSSLLKKLEKLSDVKPYGGYNAVYDISENAIETIPYCNVILGTLTTKMDTLGLDYLHFSKTTWAIFTSKENNQHYLQETWKKIYTEWLPFSEYSLIEDTPNIFFTENGEIDNPKIKKEIWVPVRKTQIS